MSPHLKSYLMQRNYTLYILLSVTDNIYIYNTVQRAILIVLKGPWPCRDVIIDHKE